MAGRVSSLPFPRGVADPGTARAFVHDQAGAVLALDLHSGEVLWRAGVSLRPAAIVGDVLVATRVSRGNELEVVVIDADSGRELRSSQPIRLPDWARPALDDTPDFTLLAEIEGRSVVLRWAARSRYRGGAPPPAKVRARYENDASGAVRVDLDTAAAEAMPESGGARSARQAVLSTPEADVVEQNEIGDTRFQLVARGAAQGNVDVVVRAVNRTTGRTAWETVLESAPARRPKPLRP